MKKRTYALIFTMGLISFTGLCSEDSSHSIDGNKLLHWSIKTQNQQSIVYLLDKEKVSVEALEEGSTPLHTASLYGNAQAVSLLLARGANIEAKFGEDDFTPLHLAAQEGHEKALETLLSQTINLEAKTRFWGTTPLLEASMRGHTQATILLLKAGANPNSQMNHTKVTPLHNLAAQGIIRAIHAMICSGAFINAKNLAGETPLHWALRHQKRDAIRALIRHADLYNEDIYSKAFLRQVVSLASGSTPK